MTVMRACAKRRTANSVSPIPAWPRLSAQCGRDRRRPDGGDPAATKGRPAGGGGRRLGQLEEYFIEQLSVGDTFVFAGDVLRFEGLREDAAYVTRSRDPEAEIPSYNGGKFPLSTFLAQRVREMVSRAASAGHSCPSRCRNG